MGNLNGAAKDELDPNIPSPGKMLLDEATDDGTEN